MHQAWAASNLVAGYEVALQLGVHLLWAGVKQYLVLIEDDETDETMNELVDLFQMKDGDDADADEANAGGPESSEAVEAKEEKSKAKKKGAKARINRTVLCATNITPC